VILDGTGEGSWFGNGQNGIGDWVSQLMSGSNKRIIIWLHPWVPAPISERTATLSLPQNPWLAQPCRRATEMIDRNCVIQARLQRLEG
jgi:hypothetical protein